MNYISVSVMGYLIGCVQTSYLLGILIHKKDVRTMGSGNAGASNAILIFGKKIGILTAFIDILKAIVAVLIVYTIYYNQLELKTYRDLVYLTGLMVIIGHNHPFYMSFKGGKGTASLIGLMLAINMPMGLIGGVTLVAITYITDYIAVGTMALLAVFFVYSIVYELSVIRLLAMVIIVGMSVYKHYPNFVKIRNGNETSVKKTLFKKDMV